MVDRNLSPVDAIKTSFDIARNNIGPVILVWPLTALIVFVGALLFGVVFAGWSAMPVAAPLHVLRPVRRLSWRSGGSCHSVESSAEKGTARGPLTPVAGRRLVPHISFAGVRVCTAGYLAYTNQRGRSTRWCAD